MSRTLSKVGKVWSVIRRDGLWHALRHAWWLWRDAQTTVTSGQVLFVTSGIGDSALYRGRHVAEELRNHGFDASITTQDDRNLMRYIDRFDVFVLHRTMCTPSIMKFIAKAKTIGRTVIFETDDLTFDPSLFHDTIAYQNLSSLEKGQYSQGQSHCIVNDDEIMYATTSTETLARALRAKGKKVFVVPNKMSNDFVALAESANQEKLPSDDSAVRIGYFSGTATHDRDFQVMTEALLKVMQTYKQVELVLVGPLQLDERFDLYEERIIRKSYAPKKEHFKNIGLCDIAVAPLEIGDPFCEAKSEIKFTEAGLMHVPVVASATEVYQAAIEHGHDGFVAGSTDEWFEYMEALVCDASRRQSMGQAAYQKVMRTWTTAAVGNTDYYTFLRHVTDRIKEEDIEPLLNSGNEIDTAIIIANWNGKKYLKRCLESLREQHDQSFHVIIAENNSTDGSLAFIKKEYPEVSWISFAENMGFAHANNAAINAAFLRKNIRYIVTLNNDTECDKYYVMHLRQAMLNNELKGVGSVQPKVLNYYEKEKIDATGVVVACEFSSVNRGREEEDRGQYDQQTDILGPSASAAMYTRKALEDVKLPHEGYFDRDYFAYYEDVDLLWRLRTAGYGSVFVSQSLVYHVHSATGHSYSPFKAFHIHRNHFYNIIKLAPLPFFIYLVPVMAVRYVLLILSVLHKQGASAKLQTNLDKNRGQSVARIVLRSWREILGSRKNLLRKRRFIQKKRVISAWAFWRLMRAHRISLRDVIFK